MRDFDLTKFDPSDPAGPGEEYARGLINERLGVIARIQADLMEFGINQGYTLTQAKSAIENLFRTFSSSWFNYVVAGVDDITTDINDDVTLTWLNIAVGHTTVREKLISRLS